MMNMGGAGPQMPAGAPPGMPGQMPMMPPPPPPQPVDPLMLVQAQETLKKPTWDDVMALLHNDRLRSFRIDIETDSTIAADEQGEKEAVTDFVGMIGQFLGQMGPLVQSNPALAPLVVAMLKASARRFKLGRQLEVVIDEVGDKLLDMAAHPPAQQVDPKVQAAQLLANAKIEQGQAQVQIQAMKSKAEVDLKHEEAQASMGLRQAQAQADAQLEYSKAETDAQVAALKAMTKPTPANGLR